jgi:DNA-binding response OmpR family regulator
MPIMETILLVTDSQWVRNDIEAAIVTPTTTINHVTDPRAVVEAAGEAPPSIYVVDMQVGSMGGMAITRAIKAAAINGQIIDSPVLLLLDRTADEFIAKRAGADRWVVKPFTAQAFRAAMG